MNAHNCKENQEETRKHRKQHKDLEELLSNQTQSAYHAMKEREDPGAHSLTNADGWFLAQV